LSSSELRGIERHRHRAEIGEPRLDRRLRQHGADLTLEACDDGRGRTLGRAYAGPGPCLVYPGNASAIVGTSGSASKTPAAGDRERTQSPPINQKESR
jgi:hypothetical protein